MMEDLVRTLLTGLIVSIVFIAISYFFWKRFDKPTEKMIENQQSKAKLRHERKMWRAVEDQMIREQATAEEEAIYQRRKADERERAKPPEQGVVSNAWASLGMENIETTESNTSSVDEKKTLEDIEGEDDSDVLLIQDPVEVRQDGETVEEEVVEAPNAPPDWQLVEKLSQLSQSEILEVTPHPEIPQAPELSPISLEVEEELPTIDIPPEHQQMSEEPEIWNPKKELVADSQWAVYWQ